MNIKKVIGLSSAFAATATVAVATSVVLTSCNTLSLINTTPIRIRANNSLIGEIRTKLISAIETAKTQNKPIDLAVAKADLNTIVGIKNKVVDLQEKPKTAPFANNPDIYDFFIEFNTNIDWNVSQDSNSSQGTSLQTENSINVRVDLKKQSLNLNIVYINEISAMIQTQMTILNDVNNLEIKKTKLVSLINDYLNQKLANKDLINPLQSININIDRSTTPYSASAELTFNQDVILPKGSIPVKYTDPANHKLISFTNSFKTNVDPTKPVPPATSIEINQYTAAIMYSKINQVISTITTPTEVDMKKNAILRELDAIPYLNSHVFGVDIQLTNTKPKSAVVSVNFDVDVNIIGSSSFAVNAKTITATFMTNIDKPTADNNVNGTLEITQGIASSIYSVLVQNLSRLDSTASITQTNESIKNSLNSITTIANRVKAVSIGNLDNSTPKKATVEISFNSEVVSLGNNYFGPGADNTKLISKPIATSIDKPSDANIIMINDDLALAMQGVLANYFSSLSNPSPDNLNSIKNGILGTLNDYPDLNNQINDVSINIVDGSPKQAQVVLTFAKQVQTENQSVFKFVANTNNKLTTTLPTAINLPSELLLINSIVSSQMKSAIESVISQMTIHSTIRDLTESIRNRLSGISAISSNLSSVVVNVFSDSQPIQVEVLLAFNRQLQLENIVPGFSLTPPNVLSIKLNSNLNSKLVITNQVATELKNIISAKLLNLTNVVPEEVINQAIEREIMINPTTNYLANKFQIVTTFDNSYPKNGNVSITFTDPIQIDTTDFTVVDKTISISAPTSIDNRIKIPVATAQEIESIIKQQIAGMQLNTVNQTALNISQALNGVAAIANRIVLTTINLIQNPDTNNYDALVQVGFDSGILLINTNYFSTIGDKAIYKTLPTTIKSKQDQYQYGDYIYSDSAATNLIGISNNLKNATELVIPQNVQTISSKALWNMTKLQSIDFSTANLKLLPSNVLLGSVNVKSIRLPDNLQLIESGTFNTLSNIEFMNWPAAVSDSVMRKAIGSAKIFIPKVNKDNKIFTSELLDYNDEKLVLIPNNVVQINKVSSSNAIDDNIFTNNSIIKRVVFQDNSSLLTLGNGTFSNMSKLIELHLPGSLSGLADSNFKNLRALRLLDSQNQFTNLSSIGSNTFMDLPLVKELDLSNAQLPSVLGSNIFCNDRALETLRLPDSIAAISGNNIFANLTSIKYINCPSSIPQTGFFANSFFNKDNTSQLFYNTPVYVSAGNGLAFDRDKAALVPNTARVVWLYNYNSVGTQESNEIFKSLPSLRHVDLPVKLETIYSNAFVDCVSLRTIGVKDDSLKTIYTNAIYSCNSLKEFYIPRTIETIQPGAFTNDLSLATVVYSQYIANATGISNTAFRVCASLSQASMINCPTGLVFDFSQPEIEINKTKIIRLYDVLNKVATMNNTIRVKQAQEKFNNYANLSREIVAALSTTGTATLTIQDPRTIKIELSNQLDIPVQYYNGIQFTFETVNEQNQIHHYLYLRGQNSDMYLPNLEVIPYDKLSEIYNLFDNELQIDAQGMSISKAYELANQSSFKNKVQYILNNNPVASISINTENQFIINMAQPTYERYPDDKVVRNALINISADGRQIIFTRKPGGKPGFFLPNTPLFTLAVAESIYNTVDRIFQISTQAYTISEAQQKTTEQQTITDLNNTINSQYGSVQSVDVTLDTLTINMSAECFVNGTQTVRNAVIQTKGSQIIFKFKKLPNTPNKGFFLVNYPLFQGQQVAINIYNKLNVLFGIQTQSKQLSDAIAIANKASTRTELDKVIGTEYGNVVSVSIDSLNQITINMSHRAFVDGVTDYLNSTITSRDKTITVSFKPIKGQPENGFFLPDYTNFTQPLADSIYNKMNDILKIQTQEYTIGEARTIAQQQSTVDAIQAIIGTQYGLIKQINVIGNRRIIIELSSRYYNNGQFNVQNAIVNNNNNNIILDWNRVNGNTTSGFFKDRYLQFTDSSSSLNIYKTLCDIFQINSQSLYLSQAKSLAAEKSTKDAIKKAIGWNRYDLVSNVNVVSTSEIQIALSTKVFENGFTNVGVARIESINNNNGSMIKVTFNKANSTKTAFFLDDLPAFSDQIARKIYDYLNQNYWIREGRITVGQAIAKYRLEGVAGFANAIGCAENQILNIDFRLTKILIRLNTKIYADGMITTENADISCQGNYIVLDYNKTATNPSPNQVGFFVPDYPYFTRDRAVDIYNALDTWFKIKTQTLSVYDAQGKTSQTAIINSINQAIAAPNAKLLTISIAKDGKSLTLTLNRRAFADGDIWHDNAHIVNKGNTITFTWNEGTPGQTGFFKPF